MLEFRLLNHRLHDAPQLRELQVQHQEKQELSEKMKALKKDLQGANSVLLLDELKARKRVLRRLGFINDADVVQLKARAACEISTGDELVLSELLFESFFNDLTTEQCAACLSCFIFEEKSVEAMMPKNELSKAYSVILNQARKVGKIQTESKVEIDEKHYLESFKYDLMEVVLAWAKGTPFAQIWSVRGRTVTDNANDVQQDDGRVRRQPDPAVQAARGAAATDGSGRQGHGQRGAREQVQGGTGEDQAGPGGSTVAVPVRERDRLHEQAGRKGRTRSRRASCAGFHDSWMTDPRRD